MRVRTGGSHHQKFVVIRHRDDPSRDVAFVGGIDLAHNRRDDADHGGDPQPQPLTEEYGAHPPWHDVQVAIQGPAVHDVETVFRERWEDPTPLSPRARGAGSPTGSGGLDTLARPAARAVAPAAGGGARTSSSCCGPTPTCGTAATTRSPGAASAASPAATPRRSARAERIVYVEDQYFWGHDVADAFAADAARRTPSSGWSW